MNRKHNPWVALVALLLLVTLLVTVCIGCGVTQAEAEEPDRFTTESYRLGGSVDGYIITDNKTGVQYLMATYYRGGIGMTVLQPTPAEEG